MSSARPDPSAQARSTARIPDTSHADPRPYRGGVLGVGVRAFWMLLGNALLALLLVAVLHREPWSLSRVDAAYWAVVVLLLAARSADVRWLDGRTAQGEPVTPAHLRRYLVTLVGVSAAAWICAQAVQP